MINLHLDAGFETKTCKYTGYRLQQHQLEVLHVYERWTVPIYVLASSSFPNFD